MRAFLAVILVAGCAAESIDDTSDTEAETAAAQVQGKADAPDFTGLYASHATTHYNNDIPALQLLATDYVRARCYHASCSERLPETDHYDVYTSSAGKTYVRFYTVKITFDANHVFTETPVVADVYEIAATSAGVKLRKSYTTRWFTLYRTTEQAACTSSKGTWDASTGCACPDLFVPGQGGCMAHLGENEGNCDDSDGLWTDDDATLIGSYCVCGEGRHVDASGACAND